VFDLLLLAEVEAVVGGFAAAHGVHARGGLTAFECALGSVAASAFEEQLAAVTAALAADGSTLSRHGRLSSKPVDRTWGRGLVWFRGVLLVAGWPGEIRHDGVS
jgi:hypothetical protein